MKKITLLICAFICVLSPLFGQEYDVYAEEEESAANQRKTTQITKRDKNEVGVMFKSNERSFKVFNGDKEMSKAELEYVMMRDCPLAYDEYKSASRKRTASWVFGGVAAGFALTSFCLALNSTESASDSDVNSSAYWVTLGAGVACIVPSIVLTYSSKRQTKRAVELFNECKKTSAVEFQLKLGGGGAGLSMAF